MILDVRNERDVLDESAVEFEEAGRIQGANESSGSTLPASYISLGSTTRTFIRSMLVDKQRVALQLDERDVHALYRTRRRKLLSTMILIA